MKYIGTETVVLAIQEIFYIHNIPKPEIECYKMVDRNNIKIRIGSPWFKTSEDYIDDSWEKNR